MDTNNPDFSVESNHSFFIVSPNTESARAWFLEWTIGDLLSTGDSFLVDRRYIHDLCTGIILAGFTIDFDGSQLSRDPDGELVLD